MKRASGASVEVTPKRRAGTRRRELCRTAGAASLLMALAAPAGAASPPPVLPQGGQFVAGSGMIAGSSNAVQINQQGARGIIDWRSFSIGAGGGVTINNGSGATLNRVTGGQISSILGKLSATGSLYLVNPQGLVIGADGKVVAGGSVTLSTRAIDPSAFMAGGAMTAQGASPGDVSNLGQIMARQGNVVLIGRSVSNTGSILAKQGQVDLAAANSVLLTTDMAGGVYVEADPGSSGDVTEAGRIRSAAAQLTAAGGNVYTLAGNRSDLIQASGTASVGGQVWLTAPNGTVSAAGTVTAVEADGSGGRIVVNGAKATAVSGRLDAGAQGTGGSVLVGVSAPQTGLSSSTTVADGAVIRTGANGRIETSGHQLVVGAADVRTGAGGHWLLDPVDLTIDAPAAATLENQLAGASASATAAGNLTVASGVSWSNAASALTLTAGQNLTISAPITGAGALIATAGGALASNAAVSASSVSLTASGGNLTIGSASITGTGAGAAVTLATTGNLINNAGPGAVLAPSGRWLVYSTNPGQDTTGGLAPDFYQYNAAIGAGPSAAGNGLLYSTAPSVSYSLTGSVAKTYDGANAASGLTAANFSASGLIGNDVIAASGPGTYSQSDVGNDLTVTIPGVSFSHAGKPVYGYSASGVNQGVIGQITPASVTVSINTGPTKTYDDSSAAVLPSASYTVTSPVTGQTFTVVQAASVNFGSLASPIVDAGTGLLVTATFSPTSFAVAPGASAPTKLSNYTFPTSVAGTGTIGPAPLHIIGLTGGDKVYDGTSTATVHIPAGAQLVGVVGSDDVSIANGVTTLQGAYTAGLNGTPSAAVGAYAVTLPQTASALAGAKAQDYVLATPMGLIGSITPRPLTITGVTVSDRPYDGTASAALGGTPTLDPGAAGGVVAGDDLTLSGSGAGAFAQANVGSNLAVSVGGFTLASANGAAGNYSLSMPTGLIASITPRALTVGFDPGYTPTKTYNGTTDAPFDPSKVALGNVVSGQSVSLTQALSAQYASKDVGSGLQTVTYGFAQSDFQAGPGALLSNYQLPASKAILGLINPAPLSLLLTGDPTKTYDGTDDASPVVSPANIQIRGFVSGEGATAAIASARYNSPNASSNPTDPATSVSASVSLTGTGATNLSNYSYSGGAAGVGHILQADVGVAYVVADGGKVYDGTTAAPADVSGYVFSFVGSHPGDLAVKAGAIVSGAYGSANVGEQSLSLTLQPNQSDDFTGTNLSNYNIATTAFGSGLITPRPASLNIVGNPTKVYNGDAVANLTSANFQAAAATANTGFVGSDGVSVNQAASAAYNSRNATANGGATSVTANLQLSDLTPRNGALLSNYDINLTAVGPGVISLAPLLIQNTPVQDKVYDKTTAATLPAGSSLYGVVAGDDVTLHDPTSVSFPTTNVGLQTIVSSGFTVTGGEAGNYSFAQPVLTASITPRPVTINGLSVLNGGRDYDGTTSATLTGTAGLVGVSNSGVLAGDAVAVDAGNARANFSQANVANNLAVTAAGYGLTSTDGSASNYSLVQPGGLTGNITPKALTVTFDANAVLNKVYDGTSVGYLKHGDLDVAGFAAGEGADVAITQVFSANYQTSAGANTVHVSDAAKLTAMLVAPDYRATTTDLSNYLLPGMVSHAAAITPAPLIGQIVGNPTKSFDNTTPAANLANTGTGLLTPANYNFIGLVGSDSITLNHPAGAYGSVNAGIGVITASGVAAGEYTAGPATQLSDYLLPSTATGGGTINRLALTASVVNTITKTYDGNTAAALDPSADYSLSTLPSGQSITIGKPSGTYAGADAGSPGVRVSLAAGDFTAGSGTSLSNYILPTQALGPGLINPKPISLVQVEKTYDANSSVSGATFSFSGLVAGDGSNVTLNTATLEDGSGVPATNAAAQAYGSPNAGGALAMTLTNASLAGTGGGNYTLGATTLSGAFGKIDPRTLTLGIVGNPTRDYDGGVAIALDPASNFAFASQGSVNGLQGVDSISFKAGSAQLAAGQFTSKDAKGNKGSTVKVSGLSQDSTGVNPDFQADGATLLSNYILPTTAQGLGTINAVAATLDLDNVTKVYDGTLLLPTPGAGGATYHLSGIIGSDPVYISGVTTNTGSGAYYGSANVGSGIAISNATASNFSLGGAAAGDYVLTIGNAIGVINPRPLIVSINATKAYDGTAALGGAAVTLGFGGVVSADSAALLSGAAGSAALFTNPVFNSKNVAAATTVSTGGLTWSDLTIGGLTGGQIAQFEQNYSLQGAATGTGRITPVTITGSIAAQSKGYDGTTLASLAASDFVLQGFVGGERAGVTRTSGIYFNGSGATADTNANAVKVGAGSGSAALAAGDYADTGSTGFIASNYVLPTELDGAGSIAAKTLHLVQVSKTYDGGVAAGSNVAGIVYALDGLAGDDVRVAAANGGFAGKDVSGSPIDVTLTGLTLGGAQAGDYLLASSVTNAPIGTITPITLGYGLSATKAYDGGTAAALSEANLHLTGFLSGEGVSLTAAGSFDSKDVDTVRHVSATIGAGSYTPAAGTVLADYVLPTGAIVGTGTITPITLGYGLSAAKPYDGGTAAALTAANLHLTGFIGSDGASLAAAGAFNGKDVDTATQVSATLTAGAYTAKSGTDLHDYILPTGVLSGPGTITPITLGYGLSATKAYDGGTSAALAAADLHLTGFIGSEGVSLSASGAYNAKDVGAASGVSAFLASGAYTAKPGTDLADYVLPAGGLSGPGTITPITLGYGLSATKPYDGGTAAALSEANLHLTGFLSGEGASLTAAGSFDSKDVDTVRHVSATIGAGSYTPAAGTVLADYVLPTGAIVGNGTITPITLGYGLSAAKPYDGGTATALTAANLHLTGFLGPDGVTFAASGVYDSKDVVSARSVAASGVVVGDYAAVGATNLADYVVPTGTLTGTGVITPIAVAVALNPQTKVYDGGVSAVLSPSDYRLTGFVAGEGASVGQPAGAYDHADVATAASVSAALPASDFIAAGGTLLSNYALPTGATGRGTITPRPLTAVIAPQTKPYDATVTAPLTSGDYRLANFVAGQGATVSQPNGAYDSKDVRAATGVSAALAFGDFTADAGTNLGNYLLPDRAAGPGTITPAPLQVTGLRVSDKVYDGTTAASLDVSRAGALSGVYAGDVVVLATGPNTAVFTSPDAGPAVAVNLSGGSIAGPQAGDYVLMQAGALTAAITPRPLTAAIVGTPTKTYDGDAASALAPANYALLGFVAGQGAVVNQALGTYASANAGGEAVSAALAPGAFNAAAGTSLSNYVLPTVALGPGLINQAALAAAIIGVPTKTYDGGPGVALTPANFRLTGFVSGQGATVAQVEGTYAAIVPGAEEVSAALAAGDFGGNAGTLLANYRLPASASGPGLISPTPSADLYTGLIQRAQAQGAAVTQDLQTISRQIVFAVATPRIYVPFPAPGALSTWKGNGLGSLPIVIDAAAGTQVAMDDGQIAVQSGEPVINNTEQVLLQGAKNKQFHIVIPAQATPAPVLGGQP